MALLTVLLSVIAVVSLLLVLGTVVCIDRQQLRELKADLRPRLRLAAPGFGLLVAVLIANSLTRRTAQQLSWLIGFEITDQIYRIGYDGSVADEHGAIAIGGPYEQLNEALQGRWREGLSLAEALRLAIDVLAAPTEDQPARELPLSELEVAVLDRGRPRRVFRRLPPERLAAMLGIDE